MMYMFDSNIASYFIKNQSTALHKRLRYLPTDALSVSVVTKAEVIFGWTKIGRPELLGRMIQSFMSRVQVLPWDEDTADVYASFKMLCRTHGVTFEAMDMMIAAHAIKENAILITQDKAFISAMNKIPNCPLQVENWLE